MLPRLFALFLYLSTLSFGGELYLTGKEGYELGRHLHYFEDSEGAETIDTIKKRSFKAIENDVPSFGFTDSVYWFKITLIPDYFTSLKWWLSVEYPLLESIELYGFKADDSAEKVLHTVGGRLHPYETRELAQRQFTFAINEVTEPLTLYIRVKTQSSMQVPMQLKTAKALFEESQASQLLYGLYYGVFMIIILYNLIIYIYTKENDYLRYLFFIISFIGWQLTLDGIGIQYFWSDWEWMVKHGGVFWMSMGFFFALQFSRYFLRTRVYLPMIDLLLVLLIIASFILILFSIIMPYGTIVPIAAGLAIIVPLVLWFSGILTWFKHYRPARFYVVGWSVFLFGSILMALSKLNVIQGYYLFNHIQQVGSMFEMIFLSLALADRVRLLQAEYVEKLSSLNVVLHGKVREALDDAREKDKVMLKQSRLAALGEMIEQIAHQWRQPLNTMALLNQDIYIKQQLGTLKDEDFERTHEQINNNLQYMSKTIDDFRNMHLMDKEQEHFTLEEVIAMVIALNEASLSYSNITCHVESTGEHYVKSYKNELIQILMNLMKNSRDAIEEKGEPNGHIDICVKEDSEHFMITVEDNGGGIGEDVIDHVFEPYFTTKGNTKGSGIGLFMSRTIIEENLHGFLNVENGKAGARFTITLPKRY